MFLQNIKVYTLKVNEDKYSKNRVIIDIDLNSYVILLVYFINLFEYKPINTIKFGQELYAFNGYKNQ